MNKNNSFGMLQIIAGQKIQPSLQTHVRCFNAQPNFLRDNPILYTLIHQFIRMIAFYQYIIKRKVEIIFDMMSISKEK